MLNKPIYVGFTVLELSKWLLYDFHCRFIKKHFDAELLFTDTDSVTYEINKISLSCFDGKRFVLNNDIHTLAYFHKDLKKQILTDDHK